MSESKNSSHCNHIEAHLWMSLRNTDVYYSSRTFFSSLLWVGFIYVSGKMKRCLQNLARICISIFEVNFSPFTLKVWVFASWSQAETQLAGGRAQQTSRFLQKKVPLWHGRLANGGAPDAFAYSARAIKTLWRFVESGPHSTEEMERGNEMLVASLHSCNSRTAPS